DDVGAESAGATGRHSSHEESHGPVRTWSARQIPAADARLLAAGRVCASCAWDRNGRRPTVRMQVSQSLLGGDGYRLQRAALWSTYFHRFFGPVRTASDIPTGLMPMSRSETCQALWQLFRDPDKTAHPHPRMLTRCLANILHSGYRPKAQYQDAFNYLTRRAVRIRNTHAAAA